MKYNDLNRGLPKTIVVKRTGVGFGFTLGGGVNSPLGDQPITVRKIFKGGQNYLYNLYDLVFAKLYVTFRFPC